MTIVRTQAHGIVKDTSSGALLNTDRSALEARKLRKKNSLKVENVERDVTEIKKELEQIRSILLQLVNR
jgi:hypothetical protein